MELLDHVIARRQARLRQSALCTTIANPAGDPPVRLAVVPAMLCFALGSREVLAALQDEFDRSALQRKVHARCKTAHVLGLCYMEDLARIDHARRLLAPACEHAAAHWARVHRGTRDLVRHAAFLARTHQTPYLRMAVLDAMDAMLGCFNESLGRTVRELGLDEGLRSLGLTQAPARGWPGQARIPAPPPPPLFNYVPRAGEVAAAAGLVHELFDLFEAMFESWQRAIVAPRPLALAA